MPLAHGLVSPSSVYGVSGLPQAFFLISGTSCVFFIVGSIGSYVAMLSVVTYFLIQRIDAKRKDIKNSG